MEPRNNDNDTRLLFALKEGDHRAFELLFEKYAQKLFVFSLSYLKNEEETREIVQEIFLKVWLNRQTVKTDTSFQAYLFTIAYNAIRKSFNRKARETRYKLTIIDELDEDQDPTDYESGFQQVLFKLDQFIAEMPDKRREIFIQRKQQGKSVKQIAKDMDISMKTVENQITEAMRFLKRRFEDELPGGLLFLVLFSE